MSYDVAFWKRSKQTKTAMLVETYKSICEGHDHISMDFFDSAQVLRDLEDEFGDLNDFDKCPFTLDIGEGENGNWIIVNSIFSKAQEVEIKCKEIALKNDIMLFNPQRISVWNNKRPK